MGVLKLCQKNEDDHETLDYDDTRDFYYLYEIIYTII